MNTAFTIILTSPTGEFHLNLSSPIRFAKPYECACIEASYNQSWINYEDATMTVYPTAEETIGPNPGQGKQVSLPRNFYRNLNVYLNALKELLPYGYKKYLTINRVDNTLGYFEILCVPHTAADRTKYNVDEGAHIVVSDYLRQLLNMDTNVLQYTIQRVADLTINKKMFFLESDFTSFNHFNNSQKSYLFMTQLPRTYLESTIMLTKQVVNPIYVPLRNKDSLQNLNLTTKFENGDVPTFTRGLNIITLHFRPIV